ncbi:hypothetical protein HMPREF9477_00793 [Lachnospiraceae bacterium 2_1_46FAA]|nr:hypothetical protein HMPREF9477_00793 [Lachnospiraceae bacterium 2_1_46FAA]
MKPIIECRSLTKKYGDFYALDNLNLTLSRGEIIGLLGPNGSGKTTLIKLLNGLLTLTSGEIYIDGEPLGIKTKKIVAYLPERTYLNAHRKVKDIISYFEDFYDNFDSERAYRMLKHLEINPDARLKSLSKGTKEKVQLILVMSRDADLYILDEPIGAVDPAARDYILNTILTNYNENATILLSTHLIHDIENILDRVIFIQNGHVILNSTVDEIRTEKRQSVDTLFREVFKC